MDNSDKDNGEFDQELLYENFVDPEELEEILAARENSKDKPEDTETPIAPSPAESVRRPTSMATNEAGEDIITETDFVTEILENQAVIEKREDTRGRLALIYTLATFGVFFFGMIVAVIDGLVRDVSIIENMKEILPLISGIFLGTLGFILGYYFRKGEE
jgi:hypothetical protein